MRRLQVLALLCSIGLGVAANPSPATAGPIYNLAADFSLSSNPNGTWAYGYYSGGVPNTSAFIAFSGPEAGALGQLDIWRDAVDPNVVKNTGGTFVPCCNITFNAGQVTFGPTGGPAVARWTAPYAGLFQVDASFATVQTVNAAPYAWVYDGTSFQALGVVAPAPTAFSQLVSLSAGGYVDFAVGGVSGNLKTTEVSATVTPVPEPATLSLLGLGLLGLGATLRARRK